MHRIIERKVEFPHTRCPHTRTASPRCQRLRQMVHLSLMKSWTYTDTSPAPRVHSYIRFTLGGVHSMGLCYAFAKSTLNTSSRLALTPLLFLGFRTMCDQYCISFADVEKAHINIRDFIHLTPVLTSSILNQVTGRNLFFKCELFQKTGSFKVTISFDSVSCFFSSHFDSLDHPVREVQLVSFYS